MLTVGEINELSTNTSTDFIRPRDAWRKDRERKLEDYGISLRKNELKRCENNYDNP